MKLRYYLRGLAVGILLAAVILSIANADKRPLSDAEIRVRALQLGMVDGESVRLSDRQEEDNKEGSMSQEPAESEPKADGPAEGGEPVESDKPTETEKPAESEEPAEGGELAEGESIGSDSIEDEPVETEPPEAIRIEIKGGANSYTVSKLLADAGLVESAGAFDTFLCDNGYARTIRAGIYQIVPGTGEEEIAKMIAR